MPPKSMARFSTLSAKEGNKQKKGILSTFAWA